MRYFWADGFQPPKGLNIQKVGEAVEKDSNPKALFKASKNEDHCLHKYLWKDNTDEEWANKARIEACRHIISAVKKVYDVGGRKIETRAVEFVKRPGEEGRWARIDDILTNSDLQDGYLAEIERLNFQAAEKMSKFRQLLRAKDKKSASLSLGAS